MDAAGLAQAYYDAIDDGDYDALADLLAADFVQVRPDMTHEGREAFVSFMREERPRKDTRHVVDAMYDGAEGVAARGRLVAPEGPLFSFVDVFEVGDERIERIQTFAD
ncbi:nuclear transport factor 2 family protein [Halobacterium zhouii]|uniref:nuclear transport factor 2 family protein n=1 Tax=Halobacterium zhouii TaxID=2902624 RepID=UPI001E631AAF|nr:nuclear transport factor 2 family protein [Halobacterium zhouii]